MRILVLEAAGSDQHSGLFERLDDGFVGVALFTLVVEDALAGEARRLFGEGAVFIDGIGNRWIDPARFQRRAIGGPHVEVLAAVTRRGVNEAGAGIIGDVVANKQRHVETIARIRERVLTHVRSKRFRGNVIHSVVGDNTSLFENLSRKVVR